MNANSSIASALRFTIVFMQSLDIYLTPVLGTWAAMFPRWQV